MKRPKPLTAEEVATIRKHLKCGTLFCRAKKEERNAWTCTTVFATLTPARVVASIDELGNALRESLQREHDLQQELARLRAERGTGFEGGAA